MVIEASLIALPLQLDFVCTLHLRQCIRFGIFFNHTNPFVVLVQLSDSLLLYREFSQGCSLIPLCTATLLSLVDSIFSVPRVTSSGWKTSLPNIIIFDENPVCIVGVALIAPTSCYNHKSQSCCLLFKKQLIVCKIVLLYRSTCPLDEGW